MSAIERILSRPTAKPYRSKGIGDSEPYLNKDGLLDFGPGDIENPKEWSLQRRAYITAVSILLVVNATFASSAPSACLEGIAESFHVSREAAALVITVFLLGYCAGPLLFAPLSEFYGRRWIFYSTFTAYLAFNFLCAWAPNFASLLIGRLLTGTFASAPLTNAPGVLADVWEPIHRGNAMALFGMMTFCGPALGPVIAGFLQLTMNWRWSFYVLLWLGGLTEVLLFTLPETHPPTVLLNKARRIRQLDPEKYSHVQAPAEVAGSSLRDVFKVALIRPWQILFDPISFLVAIYLSVVYMLLYMLFTIYPIVFQQKRGWNVGVGELPLIGTVCGACLGGAIVFYRSKLDAKKMRQGIPLKPEDRLGNAMLGGIMFPVCMFWFAWTANFNSVHWFVPTLAGTFLSTSILLIFTSYLNYLTDSYLMYTASAMAANTICRSACGAAAPLFTEQMFTALGVGGGGSLIGGVAVLLAPIPFVFWKYGEKIRVKSRFAPTPQAEQTTVENKPDDEEKQQPAEQRSVSGSGSSRDSVTTVSDSETTIEAESPVEGGKNQKEVEAIG
jgi:MFS transporter, DHA1 family, multidrug resistance protein